MFYALEIGMEHVPHLNSKMFHKVKKLKKTLIWRPSWIFANCEKSYQWQILILPQKINIHILWSKTEKKPDGLCHSIKMSLRHGVLYGLKGTHFRVLFGIWGDFFAARCCVSLMFQENGCLSPWYKGINTYIPLPIVFIHCNFHWCQLLTNRVFCSLPGDLSQLGIMLVSIIDLWNIMICHTNNLCLSMAKYIWSNNSRNIPYMVSVVLMTPDQTILPTVCSPHSTVYHEHYQVVRVFLSFPIQ